ncbi:hypothetical protein AURANDRAFT_22169 [Aureococcus anophagefferens]|uniref:D-lactate dehydrogenase (cytochrome) n=1 Tax=Aureococcus anophagefferens TaxID=44056 RepID=F0Y1P4_AURAN|nr:hypothetical protein AURANDRAFT_22169 [Aureococcus anophagefferens]EGB10897.1 hypothetical protein AURANDRAFT_22169 [Aureococcus anophagefferens]|eukprot:XP_009034471.1 hypothetical protein AURANDRAFT_22169 [Aureococcus anophagefferens]
MRAALRRCAVAGPPPRRALSSAAAVDDRLLASLEAVCDTSTNASILARHGKDESHHACVPPDVVAFPASTAEVSALLRLCHERRTPVVPFGVGTSLEGHVQAPRGGLSIDVGAKMTAMLEENAGDMDCRAEAGATRKAVNAALRHTGLEFMVDPGADATVGGMAACGASGTTAVRYGTMRDAVLGLTVVLADGTVLETGGRARKSSAGYDLTRLFIGSEGTLGVITEVALALHPAPSHVSAATVRFETLAAAVEAVEGLRLHGVPVARCELLDATTLAAFNAYNAGVAGFSPQPLAPSLFLEFHGMSAARDTHLRLAANVEEQADVARAVAEDCGGSDFAWSADEGERNRLWAARHSTYYASLALKQDGRAVVTDACVPLSALADVVERTAADVAAAGVVGPIFGHAGDGNFHCILVYNDDDDADYLARLHGVNAKLVARAIDAGGTCTGEHGVGAGKKAYVLQERGPAAVGAMRAVKAALDPRGIMNPGKIFD